MWIYFYISKQRIAQIAGQILPELLRETVSKWELTGGVNAEVDAEASKLLQLLAAKGKLSAGGKAEATRSKQTKISPNDELTVDAVREYLQSEASHIRLHALTPGERIPEGTRLVEFHGAFRPLVEIEQAEDILTEYGKLEHIPWEGVCGATKMWFVTSKESLVSHTPVVQCLLSPQQVLQFHGFGTIISPVEEPPVPVLPLFLGLDIGQQHAD